MTGHGANRFYKAPFFKATADGKGVIVAVRLQPAGGQDKIVGLATDADGQVLLKATVTKPPEGGKANQALLKLLAKEWRVAKTLLEVIQGETSRTKAIRIDGAADELAARLDAWVKEKGLDA